MGLTTKDFDLPKNLTVADWTKKKGLVAKAAGSTGISDALKTVVKAHAGVPWDDVLYSAVMTRVQAASGKATYQLLQEADAVAEKVYKAKVLSLQGRLHDLARLADQVSKQWKSSKLIPKVSAAQVTAMSTSAMELASRVVEIRKEWTGELAKRKAADITRFAAARAGITSYLTKLGTAGNQLKKAPMSANWASQINGQESFYQCIRGLNAALAEQSDDELKRWGKTNWTKFSLDSYRPKTDNEVLPKIDEVLAKLAELKQKVK